LTITGTTTVKAIATNTGMTDSAVATATYTILLPVATPTFTPAAGTYTGSVSVTLVCATTGSVIHYTLDGTTPTLASPVYSSAVTITATTTIKAISVKAGMADSTVSSAVFTIMQPVAMPDISPVSGNYTGSVMITISCATSGAAIRYTLDSSDPTATSPLYTAPFTLTSDAVVSAKAFNTGMVDSVIACAAYSIIQPVDTPVINPAGGNYTGTVTVTIDCATSGAEIHYTLDGTMPTAASPLFTVPILVSSSTTVKAIGIMAGMTNSLVTGATYTIAAAVPIFTPASGSYAGAVTVTLSCSTTGALIYYTTDGATPTTASRVYTGSLVVSNATTLKAIAVKSGLTTSAVTSSAYTITQLAVATPVFAPISGNYTGSVTVGISCATARATIRYTTNGTAPTTTSPVYRLPLTFSTSTTVMAQAYKSGYQASAVATGSFSISGDRYEPDNTAIQAKMIYNGQPQARSIDIIGDVDWIKFVLTEKSDIRIETYGAAGDTQMWLYGPPSSTTQFAYNDDNGASKFSLISRAGLLPGAYYIKVQKFSNNATIPAYTLLLNTSGINQVTTPAVTPRGGTYKTRMTVSLVTATVGSVIYYTTDGTDPTQYCQRYTAPMTFTKSTALKAIAYKNGYRVNTIAKEDYVIKQ